MTDAERLERAAAGLLLAVALASWLVPGGDPVLKAAGVAAAAGMLAGLFRGLDLLGLLCLGEIGAVALGLVGLAWGAAAQVLVMVWLTAATGGGRPLLYGIPVLAGLGGALALASDRVLFGLVALVLVSAAGVLAIGGVEQWVRRRVAA